MDTASVYADTRGRLLALATDLDAEQAATPVPALPGWTVKDTYSHLTGACCNFIDGHMQDAPSPAWTARQVSERADRRLDEVCAEWAGRASQLEEWILAREGSTTTFAAFDVWTHQQDIRGAVGLLGERDDSRVRFLAGSALGFFDRRFTEAGAQALRIVTDGGERVLGDTDPRATLRVDDYELLRILFGRRSLDQMEAADWDGEPAAYIDHLHLFDLPVAALTD